MHVLHRPVEPAPNKRTFSVSVGMSQRCQQWTLIDVTRSARASSIVDAERFGGLEVDNQIKSGRLFDWQIAGISSIFVCRRAFLEPSRCSECST